MTATLADAQALDAADPLGPYRARFDLPAGIIYLDGNSLGALPRATAGRVADVVRQEWGAGLIRSWNAADWIGAPQRVGAKIARLVGADAGEVIVADSTSVNLYKLLVAGLTMEPRRRTILTEPGNFPTDLYMAQGVAATLPGITVRTAPRNAIVAAADADTLVLLTHVHYRTGERFDMAAVTRDVQDKGAAIVWDLSHSVGAVELGLGDANVDFAVGCGYKYLNGGPGAPGFLFVAERHQRAARSPLSGWMGHAEPFAFGDDYAPAPDLRRFLCGTPPILGIAALESGLDLFAETDMATIAAKSRRLCDLFIARVEPECAGLGLTLVTPRDADARGSHVSFAHPHGYAVMQELIARGVIGDFREPDVIRFGFTPLYTGFVDAWTAARVLREVLVDEAWRDGRHAFRSRVT